MAYGPLFGYDDRRPHIERYSPFSECRTLKIDSNSRHGSKYHMFALSK
jgi:hypothetical protein